MTDVVCQVSNWEEVFGWAIAEAITYGKPVVGTRAGEIPELVTDSESGSVVDRGDSRAMADRLLALIGNSQLRARMGRAGSEAVASRFDLRANVGRLVDLYGINA